MVLNLKVLSRYFDRVPCVDNEASYPHIYKETRNKHQFAISYFSVWRKKTDQTKALCATSEAGDDVRDAVEYYENDKILNSYDLFHFGEGLLSVKNFPLRMAEVCLEACDKYKARLELALDVGAGPGRTGRPRRLLWRVRELRPPGSQGAAPSRGTR